MGDNGERVMGLTAEEAGLLEAWRARVAEGRFSAGVTGSRTMRVMGRAGDAPVALPTLAPETDLETLSPEERFAVDYGVRLVQSARARGRAVFSNGEMIYHFDAKDPNDLIVLSPIAGG